jgi:membrane protein
MDFFIRHLRKAVWESLDHDVLNTAKATAYSGMLMLFPAVVVLATLLAQVPEGTSLWGEVRTTFEQVLPADSMDLLQSSLQTRRILSAQLVLAGTGISVFAALGVMLTLMEGFRRAYQLPRGGWGFWAQRIRALLLIPIALFPLALATLIIIFGRQIEAWMIDNSGHGLRSIVLFFWRLARWAVSMATFATVLSALYHFGTRRKEHWTRVGPGAVAATVLWFPSTLAFGWYVTRIANYSMFYGSFGAGIATLVWIYITAFSALLGAELNGYLFRERNGQALVSESLRADRSSL